MDVRQETLTSAFGRVVVTALECYRYAKKHTYEPGAIIIPRFLPLSRFPRTPAVVFFFPEWGRKTHPKQNHTDLIRPSGFTAEAAEKIHSAAVRRRRSIVTSVSLICFNYFWVAARYQCLTGAFVLGLDFDLLQTFASFS